jgi:SAM-dependent methyltransferase
MLSDARDPSRFVDKAYLAVLGRAADPVGKAAYVERLHGGRIEPGDLILDLVSSAEFARRLKTYAEDPTNVQTPPDYIDPSDVIERMGVEGLLATADSYFKVNPNPEALLAKPFWSIAEAPELLISFGHLIAGLRPMPEDVVLDFGAGSCWTSKAYTQLGCQVVAVDASATALELGQENYRRQPPSGIRPVPRFLLFDGRSIDLPDASVDVVSCFDAFHHVPNPDAILAEFFRVLRPGGVVGFSEPGENHSRVPAAQEEMRAFGVLENDIVLDALATSMASIGFEGLLVNVFSTAPFLASLPAFEEFLAAGPAQQGYVEATRDGLLDRRMWFGRKPGEIVRDSRGSAGLGGHILLEALEVESTGNGWRLSGELVACNTGVASWRPSDATAGPVRVGVRINLPSTSSVRPGQDVAVPFDLLVDRSLAPRGATSLTAEFCLVSDGVAWLTGDGRRAAAAAVALPI